jgi:hypothetical protein
MSELNIYQRVLAVMSELSYVQKGDKTVNNQYRFVGHDAVSEAIHPMLVKHGIAMIPSVSGWKQDGNRTEVDVTVSFINVDKPEDRFEVQTFGFGVDQQDKGPGKAVSYATKYAVLKTFVLETGDDPEKDNINHVSAAEFTKAKSASKQIIQAAVSMLDAAASTSDDAKTLESWTDMDDELKKLVWPGLHDMTKEKIKTLKGAN